MAEITGFARPTLAELIDRISSDLNARLTGRDSRIRRSVLWVLARVLAGAVHLLYGFAAWIARQTLPDTADESALIRHASIWQLDPLAAVRAEYQIALTGEDGNTLEAGAILQRSDGAEFELLSNATISAFGVAAGQVRSVIAGAAGACDFGTALEIVSPVAGVDSTATVTAETVPGADGEAVEDLRARLLSYIAQRPQGGALADFDAWTHAALAGVGRVFTSPHEGGANAVVVRFSMAKRGGVPVTGADAIPSAPEVAAVQAFLDVAAPVTAIATAQAPNGHAVALSINVSPDTPEVRAAVAAELDALFARESAPDSSIPNSHLREAIARAPGESFHTLDAVDGGPGTDPITIAPGDLAYLGTITWI